MNPWLRAALAGILIGALGIPPGALMARTRRQEGPGPQTPPQPEQPAQPTPPAGPPQSQPKPQQQQPPPPQTTIAVQSNLVDIEAVVTDQDGNPVNGLKRENFEISDNGQPQQITNFSPEDAPITIVVLMEFSSKFWGMFSYKAQEWAYFFMDHLSKKDWVAVETFDLKTTLLVDFTHDRREVGNAVASLMYPGFSESALFDAVLKTLDQLRDVQGKKSILILATGYDTISRHNLDDVLRRIKETDVTIFAIGMAEELELYTRSGGGVDYLQAKNQLNTFATWTGGYAWFPRFEGEMPDIYNSVTAYLRSQYSLGFSPSTPQDGKFHKLQIDVLDDKGNPLMLADRKGKMKKAIVNARRGYIAKPPAAAVD